MTNPGAGEFAVLVTAKIDPTTDPLDRETVNAVMVDGKILDDMPYTKQVDYLNAAHTQAVRAAVKSFAAKVLDVSDGPCHCAFVGQRHDISCIRKANDEIRQMTENL